MPETNSRIATMRHATANAIRTGTFAARGAAQMTMQTMARSTLVRTMNTRLHNADFVSVQNNQANAYKQGNNLAQTLKARFVPNPKSKKPRKSCYFGYFLCLAFIIIIIGLCVASILNLPEGLFDKSVFKSIKPVRVQNFDGNFIYAYNKIGTVNFRETPLHSIGKGAYLSLLGSSYFQRIIAADIVLQNETMCYYDTASQYYHIAHPYLVAVYPNLEMKSFEDCLHFKARSGDQNTAALFQLVEKDLVRRDRRPKRLTFPCSFRSTCHQMTKDACIKLGGIFHPEVDLCQQVDVYKDLMGILNGDNIRIHRFARSFISIFMVPSFMTLIFSIVSLAFCGIIQNLRKFPFFVVFLVFIFGANTGIIWASVFFNPNISIGFIYGLLALEGLDDGSFCFNIIARRKFSPKCCLCESMLSILKATVIAVILYFDNSNLFGGLIAVIFGYICAGVFTLKLNFGTKCRSLLILLLVIIVTQIMNFLLLLPPEAYTICDLKYLNIYCNSKQFGLGNLLPEVIDNTLIVKTSFLSVNALLGIYGMEIDPTYPRYLRQNLDYTRLESEELGYPYLKVFAEYLTY